MCFFAIRARREPYRRIIPVRLQRVFVRVILYWQRRADIGCSVDILRGEVDIKVGEEATTWSRLCGNKLE